MSKQMQVTKMIDDVRSEETKYPIKKKYEKSMDLLILLIAVLTLTIGLFDFFGFLLPLVTILLAIVLIGGLPFVKGGAKYYSIGMLALGSFFLLNENAGFQLWQEAIDSNINLLLLFVLVPLLSLPVRYGDYAENINLFFHRLKGVKWKIHVFTNFLMVLLAPILTLGAVTMVKDLAPHLSNERTFLSSLTRMFGLTLFWTPYFGTVIFILQLLEMDWSKIVPYTFGFASVGMFLSFLMEKMRTKKEYSDRKIEVEVVDNINLKKLIELVIIIFMILVITLGIYYSSNFGMSISIALVSILIPILWLYYLKKIKKLPEFIKFYLDQLLPKLKGEVLLMVCAGFFGVAFVNSEYSSYVPDFLNKITGNHPLAFISCLSFIIISVAIIGLHPFILATIFAATLSNGGIPISQLVLTFVIICSWGTAIILSPYSATNLVVVRGSSFSPFKVSVSWNLGFAAVLLPLLIATAYCLTLLGI